MIATVSPGNPLTSSTQSSGVRIRVLVAGAQVGLAGLARGLCRRAGTSGSCGGRSGTAGEPRALATVDLPPLRMRRIKVFGGPSRGSGPRRRNPAEHDRNRRVLSRSPPHSNLPPPESGRSSRSRSRAQIGARGAWKRRSTTRLARGQAYPADRDDSGKFLADQQGTTRCGSALVSGSSVLPPEAQWVQLGCWPTKRG